MRGLENVSEPKFFFFNFLRKKNKNFIMTSFYAKNVFPIYNVFKKKIAHENMKKLASKVAKPAKIQPKSQLLFHKILPPLDFSIMTLKGK